MNPNLKTTPGPWAARPVTPFVDGVSHIIVSEHPAEGCWHIAEIGTHNGREVSRANAHLIAAAPELLAALVRLERAVGQHQQSITTAGLVELCAAQDDARAALAMAGRGEDK